MSAYLVRHQRWLTVERLPGYAPDLDPVKVLFGNIEGQELADLCPDDLGDMAAALRPLARVQRRPTLARASSSRGSSFDHCVTVLSETQ